MNSPRTPPYQTRRDFVKTTLLSGISSIPAQGLMAAEKHSPAYPKSNPLNLKIKQLPAVRSQTRNTEFARAIKCITLKDGKQILLANAPRADDNRGIITCYDPISLKQIGGELKIPRSIKLPEASRFGCSFDFDQTTSYLVSGTSSGLAVVIKPQADQTSIFTGKRLDKDQITILSPENLNEAAKGKSFF